MKRRIVSTPFKYYFMGFGILVISLLAYLIWKERIFIDLFLAIFGSLIVSFLIDVGNTERDKKLQRMNEEKAILSLRPIISDVLSIIWLVSSVLNDLFIIDDERVECPSMRDGICYYKEKNVKGVSRNFIKLEELTSFKTRIQPKLERIVNSHSYSLLNSSVIEVIDELYIYQFAMISSLKEPQTSSGIRYVGIGEEIRKLKNITDSVRIICENRQDKTVYPMNNEEIMQYTGYIKNVIMQVPGSGKCYLGTDRIR